MMHNGVRWMTGCWLAWASVCAWAQPEIVPLPPLTVITEEFPPYNYTAEGQVRGVSTEVVRAVLELAGESAEVRVYPWARAFNDAATLPNVALYSLARTGEREDQFHWIGVIAPANVTLDALNQRPDITLRSLDDARRYRIGVFHRSAAEVYLRSQGFSLDDELMSVYDNAQLYRLLRHGRIDLWLAEAHAVSALGRALGEQPEQHMRPVLHVPDASPGGFYLVLSKGTPETRVQAFRDAYARLRESGELAAIQARHGMTPNVTPTAQATGPHAP